MAIDPQLTDLLPGVRPPNERVLEVKIDGVKLNRKAMLGDVRGFILEIMDIRDDYWEDPITYLYMGSCRPHRAKGWGIHDYHTDRYIVASGEMLLVLFDDRDDSPTNGVVQEFYLTREGLNQVTIPNGVWHAHLNLGETELLFFNAPTVPFNHDSPDKRRLPLENDYIPYRFFTGLGH